MLKVMIVDNESAIRKGLVHCIHWGDLGCEIAAQADDGMMALEQIPVIQPQQSGSAGETLHDLGAQHRAAAEHAAA